MHGTKIHTSCVKLQLKQIVFPHSFHIPHFASSVNPSCETALVRDYPSVKDYFLKTLCCIMFNIPHVRDHQAFETTLCGILDGLSRAVSL